MKLSKSEIERIIPHREPMLLLSSIEDMNPGKDIVARFHVDAQMKILEGHFPGNPVFPGIYSVECMAQAADVLLLSTARYEGKVPLFLGIDRVKFLRKILPGDVIDIHAEILSERKEKAIVTCSAKIFNRGELAAVSEVTLAMR